MHAYVVTVQIPRRLSIAFVINYALLLRPEAPRQQLNMQDHVIRLAVISTPSPELKLLCFQQYRQSRSKEIIVHYTGTSSGYSGTETGLKRNLPDTTSSLTRAQYDLLVTSR